MTINLSSDNLLSLSQAAKEVPGDPKPNPHTLFRWHKYGRFGIRLETVMIAGKLYTTKAALFRFLDQISTRHIDGGGQPKTKRRQAAQRVLDQANV